MTTPLLGRRIVVTRAADQASKLADRLRHLGASIVLAPTIRFEMVPFHLPTDLDWIVVTSPNGVAALGDRDVGNARFAVVGPGTADAAVAAGREVSLVPPRALAESLVEVFPYGEGRVAVVQADIARRVAADGLQRKGWHVQAITAYRTLSVEAQTDVVDAISEADAITFTSGSTVKSFVAAYGVAQLPKLVISIGPVTSEACSALGIEVTVEARDHNIDGLVVATLAALSAGRVETER